MGFLRRMLTGLTLAALALGGVAVAAGILLDAMRTAMEDSPPARPNREVVRTVELVRYTAATEDSVLEVYGEVQARRRLEVRATTSGRIVQLAPAFEDGGRVIAGEVLMQIDPATADADLRVTQADLAEAEADLRDARRSLELAREDLAAAEEQAALRRQALVRQEDLMARGVGMSASVEEAALAASTARQAVVSRRQALAAAEARLDATTTRLTRAEIALSEAERLLADTSIRARFDGTLAEVTVVEGGLVTANEMLAELVDPSALEVAFRISTAQYARMVDANGALIGLPVTATLAVAGLDLTARGVIERDAARVGEGLTGRLLFAGLDGAAGFRPGDFVTVRVQEPPLPNVARLPAAAVGGDGTVLVVGPDDRLEVVPVTLLRRQGDAVLVRGPEVLDGRQVVATRSPVLGAGVKVRSLAPPDLAADIAPDMAPGTPTGAPSAALSTVGAEAGSAAAPTSQDATAAMLRLAPDRRARLVAYVEADDALSAEARTRLLAQLSQDQVPAQMVVRLERRMGS